MNNLGVFAGMMTGTGLVAWIGESVMTLFGMAFTSPQILLLIQAAGSVLVPMYVFARFRVLDPDARVQLAERA